MPPRGFKMGPQSAVARPQNRPGTSQDIDHLDNVKTIRQLSHGGNGFQSTPSVSRAQTAQSRSPALDLALAVRIADVKVLPELTALAERHIPGIANACEAPCRLPACSLSSRRTNYGGCAVLVCRRTPALAVLCGDQRLSTEIAALASHVLLNCDFREAMRMLALLTC